MSTLHRARVTVLVDNAEVPGLASEWGLSLLVERAHTRVLLDFGHTNAFARNAAALGVDLAAVDCAVLSHAHYDHADGLGAFFEVNDHAPVWLSAAVAETCWSGGGGTLHYIGVRPGLLGRWPHRLRRVEPAAQVTIAPGVHLLSHTTAGLEVRGERERLYVRREGTLVPDDLAHELTLVVEVSGAADSPLSVISSCSHAGAGAILDEVRAALPGRAVSSYVGGLHLFRAGEADVVACADALRGAGHVWCGHCTGEAAIERLGCLLPGRVTALVPGLTFEL